MDGPIREYIEEDEEIPYEMNEGIGEFDFPREVYVYQKMIRIFRSKEVLSLLEAFGLSTAGKKFELKIRALEVLRDKPADVDYHSYLAKIKEIYLFLQVETPTEEIFDKTTSDQRHQMSLLNLLLAPSEKPTQSPPCTEPEMMQSRFRLKTLNLVPSTFAFLDSLFEEFEEKPLMLPRIIHYK